MNPLRAAVQIIIDLYSKGKVKILHYTYQKPKLWLDGHPNEALRCVEEGLLPFCKRVFGEEHPHTLKSLNNMAYFLNSLGRHAEALPNLEQALVGLRRVSGEEHPDTLTSLDNLALCLRYLGRSREALPLHEQALATRRRVLGAEHPDTLTSLNNLALCLRYLGRSREALPLFEQNFAAFRRVSGAEHPDTLTSLNNLAFCLNSLGRPGEAKPFYEQALAACRRVFGAEHPDTLTSLNNLAACLNYLGRPGEAKPLYEQALAACRRVFGAEHPDTLTSLNNLAACLNYLGRPGEAKPLYEQALAARRHVLGEEHPDTLMSLNNLASCLGSLGRPRNALPLFEQALDARRRVLGEKHPDTLSSLNNLAECLRSLDRPGEALPLFEQVLDACGRVLGVEHPDTLMSLNNLAVCYQSLGRPDEARNTWISLAQLLSGQPQISKAWIEALYNTCCALALIIQQGNYLDWPGAFQNLARALNRVLDFQDPRQIAALRPSVSRFYAIYLGLCLKGCPAQVPEAFAGMQGRKLAALVLEELDRANAPAESLLGRYLAVRLKLRQLALGLQVLSGDGPAAHGRSGNDIETHQRNWAEYVETNHEYKKLHAAVIAENPQFALAERVPHPSLGELQHKLEADAALVFLIRLEEENGVATIAFIIRTDGTRTERLPSQMTEACELNRIYSEGLAAASGHSYRLNRIAFPDEPGSANFESDAGPSIPASSGINPEPVETILDRLASALNEGLWQPLHAVLPEEVRRIHLVTHAELHLLPYELACPKQWTLNTYPGFVYYYLLNHHAEFSDHVPEFACLGLRVHGAEETGSPIPLVHAEAALVKRLWAGNYVEPLDFAPSHPAIDWVHLAGHGNSDGSLYFGPGQRIGFDAIWQSPKRPSGGLIASCCLGQTREDPDGDPLSFMGAFFLRGTHYLIAALQPVSDLYMPLLVCLFYQSWRHQKGHPAQALTEAKRRLLHGDWYADTEEFIRSSFEPLLREKPVYLNGRYMTSDEVLQSICDNRARLPVADLCAWVRGFGRTQ